MSGGRQGVPSSRISDMIGGNDQGNNSLFAQASRLMASRVMPAIGKAIAGADNALINIDPRGLASGITMAGAAVTGVGESIRTKYRSPTKTWENRSFKGQTYMLEGRKAQPLALEGSSSEQPKLLLMSGESPADAPPPLSDAVYWAFTPLAEEKYGEMKQIWDASSRGAVTETRCSKPLPFLELEYKVEEAANEAAEETPAVEEEPQEAAAVEASAVEEVTEEASDANAPKQEEEPVTSPAEEDKAEEEPEEFKAGEEPEEDKAGEEPSHGNDNTNSVAAEASEEASAVAKAVAMLEAVTRNENGMMAPVTPEKTGGGCRVTRGGLPIPA